MLPFVESLLVGTGNIGDSGYLIDQSLRWRTNANQFELDGSQPSAVGSDWTVSFWIKLSVGTANDMIWSTDQNGSYSYFSWQASSGKFAYSSGSNLGNGAYRDPSAWYHIVMTPTNAWVNGVLDYSGTIMPNVATNTGGQQISYWSSGWTGSHYLADFYFIQGQNLQPTTFGNFNANGVWVPKDPGFKSGLDANYTTYLTTPNYSWNPVYGTDAPVEAFDGGTSEYVNPLTATDPITFAPKDPLPFGHQLRVFMCHYADSTYTLNGNAVDTSGMSVGVCGWQTVATGSGTLENFTMNTNTTGNWVYAFELDGQILKEGKSYSNWSRYLTTDDSNGFYPSYPAWNAFTGTTGAYAQPYTATNKLFFNPTNPIPYSQSLRIFCCKYADQQMLLNGVSIPAAVGDGTCNWNVDITGSGTLESFELGTSTVGGAYLYAIEIDGKILTDGVNSDYGANGFHLTFADPLDVGKDYSGNGNHFTTTGFDTTDYVSGYWVDNDTTATSGEVPNSQGSAYWTDIAPSNADLDYSTAGGLNLVFDGSLSTYVYWVGVGEYSVGNVESATFDLRDYTELESIELLTASGAPNTNHSYTVELLDASKNPITGTQAKTSIAAFASPEWVSVPISGTPRYMRLSSVPYTTDSIYKRLYWFGIRINGEILSQSATTAPTYDIMEDSPTNNFATINPLLKNGSTKDANLTAAGHTPCWPRPQTIAFPAEGPHMFEWQTGASTGYDLVMISADPNTVNNFGGNSIYIQAGQNTSSPNLNGSYSQVTITGAGAVFQPNKYYQVSWDGTSMRLYQEGALITTYTNFPDIPQFLGIGNNYDDQYLEYGQRGFKYPIAGFKPLSTANLPAPTIFNGRDHFQAITGSGAGGTFYNEGSITNPQNPVVLTTPVAHGVSATGFSFVIDLGDSFTTVDVVWGLGWSASVSVWCSNDGTTWTFTGQAGATAGVTYTYTISGNPFRYVRAYYGSSYNNSLTSSTGVSILDLAQQTFPSGLWWIKDRVNVNQHQLVDVMNGTSDVWQTPNAYGGHTYAKPAGDSVAWSWKAGDTSETNTDGAITSTVRANPAAGFSIVQWNGTGVTTTVGHGLQGTPEFIIETGYASGLIPVYHAAADESLGSPSYGYLNNAGAFSTSTDLWNVSTMSNTVFGVDGVNAVTNPVGEGMTAYVWTAIPGYSDFGSYTGNANADGPFVYLGFRPAFLMIKSVGAESWYIRDSSTSPINPVNNRLIANTTAEEQSTTNQPLDFLSNGFKILTTNTAWNASGQDYIYAAFAENPFGGPVPTTAR